MLVATGILILLSLGIFSVIYLYPRNRNLAVFLVLAMALRLIVAVLQEFYQFAGDFPDERTFSYLAEGVYQFLLGDRGQLPFVRMTSVPTFGSLMAVVYYLLGNHTFIIRLMNVLLGSLLMVQIFYLSQLLRLREREGLILALIVGFTPSYVLYSALVLRDIIIWMLLIAIVYFQNLAITKMRLRWFFAVIALAWITYYFRHQYAPIFAVLIAVGLFLMILRMRLKYGRVNLVSLKLLIFFLVTALFIFVMLPIIENELLLKRNASVIEYFSDQLMYRTSGGSAYLTNLQYNSLADIFFYLPLRFIHFTLGPFVWNAPSAFILYSALEALVGWYFLLMMIYNWRGFRQLTPKWLKAVVLFTGLFALLGIVANATIDSNYGTAMRHRMVYMPFIFLIAFLLRQFNKPPQLEDSNEQMLPF